MFCVHMFSLIEWFGSDPLLNLSMNVLKVTLQETWSIHDSMKVPNIEFIAYIYILL